MNDARQQHSSPTDFNSPISRRVLVVRAAVGAAIARRLDDRHDPFDPISLVSSTGTRSSGGG